MANLIEIKVPDIGDFSDVPIIELYVKVGDVVSVDMSLVTLESDKATMDVPSSHAGVVQELLVKLGDRVKEGSVLLRLAADETANVAAAANPALEKTLATAATSANEAKQTSQTNQTSEVVEQTICVPDIGDFTDVPIIELYVKVGDQIKLEDSVVTLESDKATMDVPATCAGTVSEVMVKLGDRVAVGKPLLKVISGANTGNFANAAKTSSSVQAASSAQAASASTPVASAAKTPAPESASSPSSHPPVSSAAAAYQGGAIYASPSIRAYARRLGVNLADVTASGNKGRIIEEDLLNYVKQAMSGQSKVASATTSTTTGTGLELLPWPKVDFAKFGSIETKPLSRIKKISGQNLSRNWAMIPAVTYHEDADITDLEDFRVAINRENEKSGVKITMLAFLIKAVVKAMQQFPEFNSSLDGDNLILKKYFNIGFAADTPNGLVVPVIKNAEQKSAGELAKESSQLAKDARDGKLKPADMQGACFTISSLGGIGGTYFAPIINAPEVAILGVNKSAIKPVWNGKEFTPRLILPLSLTADHRVIDGALATRFNVYIAQLLADMRRMIV